jgi:hypothetical protein
MYEQQEEEDTIMVTIHKRENMQVLLQLATNIA